MKKFFTLIFALCISLGAWADATLTDNCGLNTTGYASGSLNITTADAGDINTAKSTISGYSWDNKFFVVGPVGEIDITALNDALPANSILDLTLTTGLSEAWIDNITSSNIIGLGLPLGFDLAVNNSNLTFVYSSAATGTKQSAYNAAGGDVYNVNILQNGGLTSFLRLQDNWYLQFRTINLSGKDYYTDQELASLRSIDGVTVIEVVVVKSYTAVGGQVATDLAEEDYNDITALKVTGTLTAEDIAWMSTKLTNLTTLDLTESSLADGADLNDLSINTLKVLKVSSTIDDSSVSISTLDYIYTVYTVGVSKVKILTPGSMAAAIADNSDDAAAATSVTVTGTLNGDDLAAMSGFEAVTLLNLSSITVASGSSITSLDANGTAAILLPSTVTEAELGSLQAQTVTENYNTVQKYHCLAYFEDETNLNIYAFDGAVGRLGTFVNPGVTAITFIPRYDTNGVFYSADSEHGFIGRSTTEMNLFRAELKNLPAISMDLSILNQKYMSADFSGDVLSPYTHYLTLFGNVNPNSSGDPYIADYDFTNENSTSIKYPSTVWVVSTFKSDEDHAFVLDENGNKILISGSEEGGDAVYQRTGVATNVHYGGSRFLAATEPTNLVYVRDHSVVTAAEGEEMPSSLLAGAKNYFHGDQLYATRQIFLGDLTTDEIEAIDNDIHGDYFDFMYGATFTETNETVGEGENAKALESIVKLNNDNVKYILLPDNHEYNINATSADDCSFSAKCDNLLCVGAYNTNTNTLTTWSSAPGNVYTVTSLIRPQVATKIENGLVVQVRGNGSICNTLENVVMSGYLNRNDIAVLGQDGLSLQLGLDGATIKTADLSKAYFPTQNHMTFSPSYAEGGASWGSLTEILLPTDIRQTVIPANCFKGLQTLETLCIPYNFEEIGTSAFYNMLNLKTITTTEEDRITPKGVDEDGSYTFSSNLKSIATLAFVRSYNLLKDVYVNNVSDEPTTCEADAFSGGNYCGENGFSPIHPISRENYQNNGYYITILHLPSDIEEDVAMKYTDIDRVYSVVDETSAFNSKGELIRWPNQTELCRSFNQALDGVTWNEWPTMTNAQFTTTVNALPALLAKLGYTQSEINDYMAGVKWDNDNARPIPSDLRIATGTDVFNQIISDEDGGMNGIYTDHNRTVSETCQFSDYIGWHQFVLTDYYRAPQNTTTVSEYTKLDFYTLCIPFDLTREDVINLLGAPAGSMLGGQTLNEDAFPEVYTLKSVTRSSTTKSISLGFSKELMAIAKTGKDITITENGWNYANGLKESQNPDKTNKKVYIKGGYPYLIKPIVPNNTTFSNLGEYILSISNLTEADLGWTEEDKATNNNGGRISVPYNKHAVVSIDEDQNPLTWKEGEVEYPYYYFFQGTYTKEDLPIYAYYLGQSTDGTRNFFYDKTGTRTWNPFTAIIGGKCPTIGVAYIGLNASTSSTSVNVITPTVLMRNNFDAEFPTTQNVKINFTFEDENGFDEAVSIEKIDGEAIGTDMTEGNVYSLTGQYVGKSVNGLSKGLYIVNGKKVLVK